MASFLKRGSFPLYSDSSKQNHCTKPQNDPDGASREVPKQNPKVSVTATRRAERSVSAQSLCVGQTWGQTWGSWGAQGIRCSSFGTLAQLFAACNVRRGGRSTRSRRVPAAHERDRAPAAFWFPLVCPVRRPRVPRAASFQVRSDHPRRTFWCFPGVKLPLRRAGARAAPISPPSLPRNRDGDARSQHSCSQLPKYATQKQEINTKIPPFSLPSPYSLLERRF